MAATFSEQRDALVAALTMAGARFALTRPTQQALPIEVAVHTGPENLALIEEVLRGFEPELARGLATKLATQPGTWRHGKIVKILARGMIAAAATDESERLRAAILEHPDDDGPRLVYADWLGERGDPRGEFIVAQITGATERALALQRSNDFAGDLVHYCHAKSFSRGCVESVAMTIAEFVRDGERVFTREPVRRLVIRDRQWRSLDKLAVHPALRLVRELELSPRGSSRGVRQSSLAALATSPHLEQLVELRLDNVSEDLTVVLALRAPALESLRLSSVVATEPLVDLLAANRFPGLRRLSLGARWLGDPVADGVARLARCTHLEDLETSLPVDDHAIARLFAPDRSPPLLRFGAPGAHLTDAALRSIAGSPGARTLQRLALPGIDPGVDALALLLAATPALTHLDLTAYGKTVDLDARTARLAPVLLAVPETHALRHVVLNHFQPALETRYPRR